MTGSILLGIFIIILVLAAILVVRTCSRQPTEAMNAIVELDKGPRAQEYGSQLAKMIQKETVSSRFDSDKTKYYEFHEILEELFPLVHKTCEKHVFNGSLLFKWSGKGKAEPILLMSHQDVVEANGSWEHEPFSGYIDGEGKLWGRGTVDTKGCLYCIFRSVEELISEGFQPEGDVYIASSCTEEFSGEGAPLTVEYLKNQGIKLSC